jgi:hypothetical protein
LTVVDIDELFDTSIGGHHGDCRLDIHSQVARVHRQGVGLSWQQAFFEISIDQESPDVSKGNLADEIFDVDAPKAEGPAVSIGFSDLRLEGDDTR